ncbi:MAG: DUF4860 domain-containing protein [Coriobacteriia bacterium]|nr:DUF4860 domain-containing protein [Coriobacteriia bacterium]
MRRHFYDIVFTLVLFTLYTTVSLVLVDIGAHVYLTASDTMNSNYDQRTSVLYVAQRIRQNDSSGHIRIDQMGGSDAIVFTDVVSGSVYETWIYVSDGQLRELLISAGTEIDPDYGQAIMPMQSMVINQYDRASGLLTITFTMADGKTSQIDIYVKSSEL